jgi:hypothetical protein
MKRGRQVVQRRRVIATFAGGGIGSNSLMPDQKEPNASQSRPSTSANTLGSMH